MVAQRDQIIHGKMFASLMDAAVDIVAAEHIRLPGKLLGRLEAVIGRLKILITEGIIPLHDGIDGLLIGFQLFRFAVFLELRSLLHAVIAFFLCAYEILRTAIGQHPPFLRIHFPHSRLMGMIAIEQETAHHDEQDGCGNGNPDAAAAFACAFRIGIDLVDENRSNGIIAQLLGLAGQQQFFHIVHGFLRFIGSIDKDIIEFPFVYILPDSRRVEADDIRIHQLHLRRDKGLEIVPLA